MLHVQVDLLPGGRAHRRRTIGGLVVGRTTAAGNGYGYGAAMWHDRCPDVVDVVELTAFPRREEGLWDLLGTILLIRPGEHDLAPAIEAALKRQLGDLLTTSASAAVNTEDLPGG